MVNLSMDTLQSQSHYKNATDFDIRRKTKKSLRLSEKKQLVIKKRIEEVEKKKLEVEKLKRQNDGKEKDYDTVSMDLEEEETYSKAKQKRHWESWARVDKDVFFEALCEFGKDFDKIYTVMDRRTKGRMRLTKDCEPRNKDQIRYFYYRTWKQISKGITLQPSESKRINHEVYCLICYGELRKKDVLGFGKKELKRLDELVTTGSTTVKYRGRKVKVKPPTCKFLKKLSDEEEKFGREIESIPDVIDVELYPKSNNGWVRAQCNATNPRIRLPSLPVTVQLKSLVKLLQKRFENVSSDLLPLSSCIALYPPVDCSNNDGLLRKDSVKIQVDSLKTKQDDLDCFKSDVPFEIIPEEPQHNTIEELELTAVPEAIPASDQSTTKQASSPTIDRSDLNQSPSYTEPSAIPGLDVRDMSSNESIASLENHGQIDIPKSTSVDYTSSNKHTDTSIFPITADDSNRNDLQSCYLELGRPDKIRLEYDWLEQPKPVSAIEASGFKRLMLLSKRDLGKIVRPLKVTLQSKVTVNVKNNVNTKPLMVKPGLNTKPPQSVKSKHPPDSAVFLTPAAFQPESVMQSSGQVVTCQVNKSPICVPALKNIIKSPNPRSIIRKAPPRLKVIQPASKTLMAKAVAVNIVPQPAQLLQFGPAPSASAQLMSTGFTPAVTTTTRKTLSCSQATFSSPSTSSLSSPITIWSSPLLDKQQNSQVQVEVIQEGTGPKTSVKRLHPITVEELAVNPKRPCLEGSSSEQRLPTDFSDVNLDFLASNSNDASKSSCISDTDSVNLTSILSGLTKNLRKNDNTDEAVSESVMPVSTEVCIASTGTSLQVTSAATVSNSSSSLTIAPTYKVVSTCTSTPSVLLTPIKAATRTPSKNDQNLDSLTTGPVSFGSQWFNDDINEISLGGLIDVGNLKDQTKNSDSIQASDISIGTLLNVGDKKSDADNKPVPDCQNSLGTLIDHSQKKEETKKVIQTDDISIGTLLGVNSNKDKVKSPTTQYPLTMKSFGSDSLLMKPGGDPVIAFESLMDENSIDYINKFKDLTAKFKASSDQSKTPSTSQPTSSEACHPENSNTTVTAPSKPGDPTLPVYRSEDSVGLLDDLSFVLPVDNSSCDSVKGFTHI